MVCPGSEDLPQSAEENPPRRIPADLVVFLAVRLGIVFCLIWLWRWSPYIQTGSLPVPLGDCYFPLDHSDPFIRQQVTETDRNGRARPTQAIARYHIADGHLEPLHFLPNLPTEIHERRYAIVHYFDHWSVFDLQEQRQLWPAKFEFPTKALLRVLPSSNILLVLTGKALLSVELSSGKQLSSVPLYGFVDVCVSANSHSVAVCKPAQGLRVFSLIDGRLQPLAEETRFEAASLSFDQRGKTITGLGLNLDLHTFDVSTLLWTRKSSGFRVPEKYHFDKCFWLPGARRYVALLSETPILGDNWTKLAMLGNAETGRLMVGTRHRIPFHFLNTDTPTDGVSFSRNGDYFGAGGEVFRCADGERIVETGSSSPISFAPDGQRALARTAFGTIGVWDAVSGRRLSGIWLPYRTGLEDAQFTGNDYVVAGEESPGDDYHALIFQRRRSEAFHYQLLRWEFAGICICVATIVFLRGSSVSLQWLLSFVDTESDVSKHRSTFCFSWRATIETAICTCVALWAAWKLPTARSWFAYYSVLMLSFLSVYRPRPAETRSLGRALGALCFAVLFGIFIVIPFSNLYASGGFDWLRGVSDALGAGRLPDIITIPVFLLTLALGAVGIFGFGVFSGIRWLAFTASVFHRPVWVLQRAPRAWLSQVAAKSVFSDIEVISGLRLKHRQTTLPGTAVRYLVILGRVAFKTFAIFLLPIVYLSIPWGMNRRAMQELVYQNYRSRLSLIFMVSAAISLLFTAIKVLFFLQVSAFQEKLLEIPVFAVFANHLAPGKLYLWHITSAVNALLALGFVVAWDRSFVTMHDLRSPLSSLQIRSLAFAARAGRILSVYNLVCFFLLWFNKFQAFKFIPWEIKVWPG